MLRTEIIRDDQWHERLGAPWRDLVQADPRATPFQTWEWQSTWFRYFGVGKSPRIWTLWEGDDLIGLMPFVRIVSPWRALRPMGCGPSDYLQPLTCPGREAEVCRELSTFLTEQAKKRLVDLHQLRETNPLAVALSAQSPRAKSLRQATCLVLDLPKSYEEYLKTLGKSLRFDVRRLEKPPFSDGVAKIQSVDETNAVEGVDFFFAAHKQRWSKRGLPGAFLSQKVRNFHREWALLAAQNGWLWMSVLSKGSLNIGAIYAMRLGKACYFYQSGFDPAHSVLSPGSLLVAGTIRRAIEEGLDRFDFLRGDEPYKRRWKPQNSYQNLRIMLGSDSAVGSLGASWNQMAFGLESRIRARFEGRSLRG